MGRRVLTATIAAVTVAVLLLGVPMAVAGAVLWRQGAVSNLSLRTQSIARAVDTRLSLGLEIDDDFLQRWVADESEPSINIRVTTPQGIVMAGVDVPEDSGKVFRVSQPLSIPGSQVEVAIPSAVLFLRGAQVVGVVVGLSVIAFGVATMVARRQARRLAAPLIYLAASAEQLGAGQVRPQLRESGVEEIDLVTAELVRSGERMAARLAAEREFAANASHQLRTPLTALSMRLEEIQLVTTDEHVAEEARISLEQVERLGGVVGDLLKSSRNADGGTTEPVELEEIFSQQRAEWGPSYERAGRDLDFSAPSDAKALATPGALSQALATLLENSLKYGGGRTRVTARDARSDSGVVIEVADQGPGISDELAPRIFQRHVSSGGGTGLGLGLARDLVVADGGRLDLAQRRPPVFAIFLSAVPKHLDPDTVLPPGSIVVVGRRRRRQ